MGHDILLPFGMGAVLGALHLATLWFVSCRLTRVRRPVLTVVGSGVIRLSLLCTGLYFVSAGSWKGLLAALGGMVVVRAVAVSLVQYDLARHPKRASNAIQS